MDYLVLDSITQLKASDSEMLVIAGSHCGAYPAHHAIRYRLSAVVLHDAGVGLHGAGIRGLGMLEAAGIPAASIDYMSARIGDGMHMLAQGAISHVNRIAADAGVRRRMPCKEAISILRKFCPTAIATSTVMDEARYPLAQIYGTWVIGLDSASLVEESDCDAIVVTGSHGGLIGGKPSSAIKHAVRGAIFNDAGMGIDCAGSTRIFELDRQGIPAATVAHDSAEIGSGRSTWLTGRLTAANKTALCIGIGVGDTVAAATSRIAQRLSG